MRYVKLGRKLLVPGGPASQHWAVKVGDTWYEISADKSTGKRCDVIRSLGKYAKSLAGFFGGELVGETDKTDSQINEWINDWLEENPIYELTSKNCQKFAYEFMDWLTDGNFVCHHRMNAADTWVERERLQCDTFAGATDGNAMARLGTVEHRLGYGPLNFSGRAIELKAQAVAGPGLGVWGDASLFKAEGSVGNVVGVHLEPNLNTGAGIRNGNVDVHLLGYGGKIGADGLEINTPIGGVSACTIM